MLQNRGIERVRPLKGGLDAWRDLGYPVDKKECLEPESLTEATK